MLSMHKLLTSTARVFSFCVVVVALAGLPACNRVEPGSPEAVADAFCDAYFRQADQAKAKQFTAFGASKMLEREIADTKKLRDEGYTPSAARIEVGITRGSRSKRNERVRFDYTIRFPGVHGAAEKHADIELAKLAGEWKVVRIGLTKVAKSVKPTSGR